MLNGHRAISNFCEVNLPGGAEFRRVIAAQHEIMRFKNALSDQFARALDVCLPCDAQQSEGRGKGADPSIISARQVKC